MYKYGTLESGVPHVIKVAKDNGEPTTPILSVYTSWQVEAGVADVVVETRLIGMTDFVEQTTVLAATTIILDMTYVAEFRLTAGGNGEFSIGNYVTGR